MNTRIYRIPVASAPDEPSLQDRLRNLCEVQWAAGFRLAGCFTVVNEIVLIFQLKS
jgi:hypothetical protein